MGFDVKGFATGYIDSQIDSVKAGGKMIQAAARGDGSGMINNGAKYARHSFCFFLLPAPSLKSTRVCAQNDVGDQPWLPRRKRSDEWRRWEGRG